MCLPRDQYEWKKLGAKKQPYLIGLRSGEPFAFAGLWEHWKGDGMEIDSCTTITGKQKNPELNLERGTSLRG